MSGKAKIFGAALDATDDPERLGLKLSYLQAKRGGQLSRLPADPYAAIAPLVVSRLNDQVQLAGKLQVPGWLSPRPPISALPQLRPENYRAFLDSEAPARLIRKCEAFTKKLLPGLPLMLAVDHALCAGPISALSRKYGPASLLVVVLDSHFDALPAKVRAPLPTEITWKSESLCGEFLAGLLKNGVLLPQNLFVIGVNDFPPERERNSDYGRAYLSWLEQGVRVFPRAVVEEEGFLPRLEKELCACSGKRLYLSLDADVGAGRGFNAVRYMNALGLAPERVLAIASLLRQLLDRGQFRLAGMDVSEVDVHLLGLSAEGGEEDKTAELCAEFIAILLRKEPGKRRG